jgi:hypothetical protein
LSAELFAEEAVVVVAAIEADVVEDSTLSSEVDLVAVGALSDADSGRERQQVFKLAAEDRRGAYGLLVERRAYFGFRDVDRIGCGNGYDTGDIRDA